MIIVGGTGQPFWADPFISPEHTGGDESSWAIFSKGLSRRSEDLKCGLEGCNILLGLLLIYEPRGLAHVWNTLKFSLSYLAVSIYEGRG